MSSIAKLRVAGVEGRAFTEWARRFATQRAQAYRAGRIANLAEACDAFFAVVAMLVLFFALGEFLLEQPLAVGEFLGFNAFGQVLAAVSVIDTATGVVVATIAVGTGPFGVAVNLPRPESAHVASQASDSVSVSIL